MFKINDYNLPSNRKFGFSFSIIFFLIGIYLSIIDLKPFSQFLFAFALVFFFLTIIKDDLLYPLNKLWMIIGLALGSIVSPIVLGLIFFFIFTPISLLMKIFRRDELSLKLLDKDTYWVQVKKNGPKITNFKNQF